MGEEVRLNGTESHDKVSSLDLKNGDYEGSPTQITARGRKCTSLLLDQNASKALLLGPHNIIDNYVGQNGELKLRDGDSFSMSNTSNGAAGLVGYDDDEKTDGVESEILVKGSIATPAVMLSG